MNQYSNSIGDKRSRIKGYLDTGDLVYNDHARRSYSYIEDDILF